MSSPRTLAPEARAIIARALPDLLGHPPVLEGERAFAALEFAPGRAAQCHAGADADTTAAAEDPERRKERRVRNDRLGHPRIDVAPVGHLGAAHRHAPTGDDLVVG